MRLIDADALKNDLSRFYDGEVTARQLIDEQPTIGGWISVKDGKPEEYESIFYKFFGTPKWSSAMWKQESKKVIVCVSFPDGSDVVTTGCLHDSDWMTTISKGLPQTVTHWMPLPEPPEDP